MSMSMDEWDTPPDVPEIQQLDLLEYGGEPDLVSAAVQHMKAALPAWVPRTGNTEMVLLEAMAVMLAPEVLAVQMVPGRVVEQLVGLHGVSRSPGAYATAAAMIEVTTSAPVQTIPAGTLLRLDLSATGESVDFETTETVPVITTETRAAVVPVRAVEMGEAGNGTPSGVALEVLSVLPFVERAQLAEPVAGGRGPESYEAFMGRASAVLSRQTSTLVLPEHFTAAALADPVVVRARTLDVTDPARAGVEAAGHVTVAVAGVDGAPLPQAEADALQVRLSSQALASLTVHVVPPTVTDVPVALTVRAAASVDPEMVRAGVVTALQTWLDPDTWDWSTEVTQFGIVGAVSRVHGVAAVESVESGPRTLPGLAPLARAGALTVVVK